MDLKWVDDLSKEFTGVGFAPTPDEIIAVKSSVPILAQRMGHDAYLFWGKIIGSVRNYLIIVCYTGGLMGDKKYYASLDGVSWFGLPAVTPPLLQHAAHIRDKITGNPLTRTSVRHPRKPIPFKDFEPLIPPKPRKEEEEEEEEKEQEEVQEEEEKEEEEEMPEYETVSIAEDQRLACLIHRIDKNGLIFPQDALIWSSSDSVKINPLFKGIAPDVTLDDFCRLDPSVRGENARPNGIVDTMPLLSEDLPVRGWSVWLQENSDVAKIINKLWPGLCFIAKGSHWGTVYLGKGERNVDFLFASE
jgi:hypothetical protein